MINDNITRQAPQEPQVELLPVGNGSTPYKSITASNVQPGQGDVIATLDLKVGSILIRRVSVRRGRGDATFVNYPSRKNKHGKWLPLVEILSPALETAVREEIYRAVGEVVR